VVVSRSVPVGYRLFTISNSNKRKINFWPECPKLFGHNTEMYCLSASCETDNNEVLLASSCKARDADDAEIRLWNVRTGQCVQVLSGGHRSTVATMSFSSNGHYLATSGKDRWLCLWKRQNISDNDGNTAPMFELIWALDSAHKRIVWSVHFCPYESKMLASGSRDGIVKIWSTQDDNGLIEIVKFSPLFQRSGKPDAVTSLAFAPTMLSKVDEIHNTIIAVGLESGRIEFWCISYTIQASSLISANSPYPISCIDPSICHCDTVTKLTWRPPQKTRSTTILLHLASCSLDHGCRIFEIELVRS
jgi:elongator complex protein 2